MATEITLAAAELRKYYFRADRPGYYKFLWVLSSSNDLVYEPAYSIHRNATGTQIGCGKSWTGTIGFLRPVSPGDNLENVATSEAVLGNNHSGKISGFAAQYVIRNVIVEMDEGDEFHVGPIQGSAEESDYLTILQVNYIGPNLVGHRAFQGCGVVAGT